MQRVSIPRVALGFSVLGALGLLGQVAVAASASASGSGASGACAPTVAALPLPSGDTNGDVLAGRHSIAAGYVADDQQHQDVAVWTRGPSGWAVQDLGNLGVTEQFSGLSATGVNRHGQVAIGVNTDVMGGWLYTNGHIRRLHDFAGGTMAYARAINRHGVVAGEALDAAGNDFAAVWPHWWSAPRKLPPLPGYDGSFAQGIDAHGDVTGGTFSYGDLPQKAVRWSPTGYARALTGLGGNADGFGVRRSGEVVGESSDASDVRYAVVWRTPSAPHSLGLFGSNEFSRAFGVNSSDTVIGFEGINPAPPAIPQRQILYWPGSGAVRSLLPLSLNWADGAYSHTLDNQDDVFGASSATAGALPRPTVWTCAFEQSFVPPSTPGGATVPREMPKVVGLPRAGHR